MKEKIRQLLSSLGYNTKPDFIIIGAQKAGTTGLFNTLKKHSKLNARIKEIHYFDNDAWYAQGKLHQYHSCFPAPHNVPRDGLIFEATPIYLYHPEVPKRLYDYNPNLKLIVTLRNPAERALSAWTMYHHHFTDGHGVAYYDPRSFAEAINEEIKHLDSLDFYQNRKGYVYRGVYVEQLINLFRYVPKENVLILENKEVFEMSELTSKKIQSFVGVDYQELKTIVSNKARLNISSDYQDELRMLKEFYAPANERLFDLIGRRFDWN